MPLTHTKYKDRLFRFIFGNPDKREWTLNLYNAMNNSHYTDPNEIEYNTIEDAVYLGMKNDVSFIIVNEMNLWEHQSSYNPNMPVRFLIYAAKLYDKYFNKHDLSKYGRKLQKVPHSKCVCFYNGTEDRPEQELLKLSDAFIIHGAEADIEVVVKMLNINYGHNKKIMETSIQLGEYAWFVDRARTLQDELNDIDLAIDTVIEEMPDSFSIKKFLIAHKAEVKGMFLTEYNEEKERRLLSRDLREEVHEETITSVVTEMLREKLPLSVIAKVTKASSDFIYGVANNIGIPVVM